MAKVSHVGRRRVGGSGGSRRPVMAAKHAAGVADPLRASTLATKVAATLAQGDSKTASNVLEGAESPVRFAALEQLAGLDDGGLTALRQLAQASSELVAEAAIVTLGRQQSPDAVTLLVELAQALPKGLAKEARRALARLSAAGLDVPQAAPSEPIFQPRATGVVASRAIITGVDGSGQQGILATFTHVPAGTYVATGVVNERLGLLSFSVGRLTQTELQHEWGHWLAPHPSTGFVGVEAPYDYVANVIQRAVERARNADVPIPDDYEGWTQSAPGPSMNYERVPLDPELESAADGASPSPDDFRELLDEPEIAPWFFAFSDVQSSALQMHEAETSQIALSPEAKGERIDRIVGGAAELLLTEEIRERYAHRLETAAYVFFHSDREQQAANAIVAARTLRDAGQEVRAQPFALGLVERTLRAAMEAEAPATETGRRLLGQVVEASRMATSTEASPERTAEGDVELRTAASAEGSGELTKPGEEELPASASIEDVSGQTVKSEEPSLE